MKCMVTLCLKRLTVVLCLLLFAASLATSQAQSVRVTGSVTNENGEPLSSASISVVGTSAGTTATSDGTFSISVPLNSTISVSAIGYAAQTFRVTQNATAFNVKLVANNSQLEQVVVVGYGTQRREAITGSVASISGTMMRDVPSPNIAQALQGRLPGVEMTQTSTRPGASMQIRIRGSRSLSASNDPLIVLDGIPFPGSITDIDPNDVKSIDILKDASATAIYGSRGANGVILITTNKGQKGQRPRISYNTYTGVQKIFAKYPMMNGPEFVALRAARGQFVNGADEANDTNFDWQDNFYRTGIVTDHNISVSGGTETGNYNFGLGYYQNQGVVPSQQYKRYSLRGSLDQQVAKNFRFGFTTYNNLNQSDGNQVGLYSTLSASPIASLYNANGTRRRVIRMAQDDQFVYTKDVIDSLTDNGLWLNENRGFASYNSIYAEAKLPFITGLKYRVNLGLDFIQSTNGAFTGQGVGNVDPNAISSASIDNRLTYHYTIENVLSYDKTFGGKHTINAVALYSTEQNKSTRSNISGQDIPASSFQFYNIGQAGQNITVNPNNQSYQLWGLMSYMGRVMYSYDNRYMISATLRSDGSSRLAPGHKWHTYPAVSVGWNISNESFMRESGLSNLKLRAGYGQTSNQAINPYATLGRLDTRPYNFGPTNYATGFFVSQLPNENLGWEFSKTLNFGVDFGLLKNRLSGTVEYYITKTEDILLGLGLPPTSGVSGYTANIGTTQNKGFELSLNGAILTNPKGVTWDAGLNFYLNENRLTALASGETRNEGNSWFVGHNINSIYDYKKIGLWTSAKDSADNYQNVLDPGGRVGMIKVLYTGGYDANGRPLRAISGADRQIMDVDPDWQGGFNTRVAYKGFDLGIVGIFRKGGILISTIHGPNGYLNLMTGRRNNIKVDYWTPTNTDAKYPNPAGPISGDNPKYASTLGYFDGSYLKIRTITLGYNFNHSLLKNSAAKLRMYFTAQNPFVLFSPFNKESGLDPETNSAGNENTASGGFAIPNRVLTVGFNTPSTRNYIVGLNLTF